MSKHTCNACHREREESEMEFVFEERYCTDIESCWTHWSANPPEDAMESDIFESDS